MAELSILIPARNEIFLARTIEDILEHAEGDTEIIVILDGAWSDPPIPDDDRVTLVYHPESIGQRAAINEAARLSTAEFVMKVDAHCSFGQGFDVKLMSQCEHDWTVMPEQRNLHAFDWVCRACGHRVYQGPQPGLPCKECGQANGYDMDVVWQPRPNTRNRHFCFDRDLHFQYWRHYKERAGDGDLVESMSLLGACWTMHRSRYWEIDGLDEGHGSWGQMGTEIACKTWLSGGRLLTNRTTWFAHLFRTQPGFGFPYPLSGQQVEQARDHSRWLWEGNNWPKAKHPLSWLIERFAPVPGWEDVEERALPETKAAILYYTCNTHDERIEAACRKQLEEARGDLPIVAVSRKPVSFGDKNIVIDGKRGVLTMHRQILAGLEAIDADYVFLCENDVLYHPSHFEFTPPRRSVFYYNINVWKVWDDGLTVWTADLQQLSGLCAHRDLLLDFYRQRVELIESGGWDRHFEPGPKCGDWRAENWKSEQPNVDIRHDGTLTRSKRSPEEFRNQRYARGWIQTDSVPGWGQTVNLWHTLISAT